MTIKDAAQTIQAFPIHSNTQVVNSPSNFDMTYYNVIHINTDGSLTFDFGSSSLGIDVVAGQDFSVKCQSITGSCQVLVS